MFGDIFFLIRKVLLINSGTMSSVRAARIIVGGWSAGRQGRVQDIMRRQKQAGQSAGSRLRDAGKTSRHILTLPQFLAAPNYIVRRSDVQGYDTAGGYNMAVERGAAGYRRNRYQVITRNAKGRYTGLGPQAAKALYAGRARYPKFWW